eukprot:CAMPEP_0116885238 /NCGR_PEP_ID=MMETSP0463-20121206/18523_1 /TAXON_ID=181622 /ORGANISM="Strombidinopsis sp, Strain SopsisLIS2011" /LENGTH=55 /DNA_ID=CAMNT_0004543329 /DNA_START=560 /DNA_END=727 /DNA_ORIENTATION=+
MGGDNDKQDALSKINKRDLPQDKNPLFVGRLRSSTVYVPDKDEPCEQIEQSDVMM